MSCLLNAGWKLNCPKLSSGIRKIYVIPYNSVGGYGINTDGIITTISTNNNPFYIFEVPPQTAEFTEKQLLDDKTGILSWQSTLKINLSKNDYLLRKLYLQLLNGRYIFIIKDGMGIYWLLGKNYGMEVSESEVTPGKVFGDFNGNKLTFETFEPEPIRQVLSSAFLQSPTYSNNNPQDQTATPEPPQG